MAFRTSISGAVLSALLAGWLGAAGLPARAGEIIEFSEPTALLDVPQPERETKQHSDSSLTGNGGGPNIPVPNYMPAPAIIVSKRTQNGFAWQPSFQKDANADEDSSLDLFAPPRDAARTNGWDIAVQKDSKNQNLTEFGAEKPVSRATPQAEGLLGKDRFGASSDGRDTWSLGFHGASMEERIHEGQYVPQSDRFKEAYGQAGNSFSTPFSSSSDSFNQPDLSRASEFSAAHSGNLSSDDSLGNTGGQQFSAPPLMRAWDEPTAVRSQRARAEDQNITVTRQAPMPSAVLAWPKMPGSVGPN